MKKKKIIILYGGFSPEREISLLTGKGIFDSLNSQDEYLPIYVDPVNYLSYIELCNVIKKEKSYIVFNALHGEDGENGKIQALFDLENIEYTGSGHLASAVAMDKNMATALVKSLSLPVPSGFLIKKNNFNINEVEIDKFPVVIKPNDKGSSVGISIVDKRETLPKAFEEAFKYSDNVLIEEYIKGRELTVTILGNNTLPVVEIIPQNGWYDFTNKYTSGNTTYQTPAVLSHRDTNLVQSYAMQIFKTFGCDIYGRVDFRYDGEKFYFLEVNTLPGMTPLSLTPKAAKAFGLSFYELLKFIIEESKKKE